MIFMNSEIKESDLEALFSEFLKSQGKNLDLQVKMCFASKVLPQGRTNFTDHNFYIFHKKTLFFGYA